MTSTRTMVVAIRSRKGCAGRPKRSARRTRLARSEAPAAARPALPCTRGVPCLSLGYNSEASPFPLLHQLPRIHYPGHLVDPAILSLNIPRPHGLQLVRPLHTAQARVRLLL